MLALTKKQKLWSFLRHYRHRLLDEDIRVELAAMYAESGRGAPVCPERLALAMLLQVAFHVPDHEVPTLTAVDRRWQVVLDIAPSTEEQPAFSQGTVFHFRERVRKHGLMTKLLEKTVALARETKGFSDKRLRAMLDSSPLWGAGRVEDTFNLIGRALRRVVEDAASLSGKSTRVVADELCLTVVSASSVKAALDVDWRLKNARKQALDALLAQVELLRCWLDEQFDSVQLGAPPIATSIGMLNALIEQDTEPDPDRPEPIDGREARRIRTGGSDRQISISDPDMRHGRKSKTKLFTGYKRHVSTDADVPGLIVSVCLLPGNQREYDGTEPLLTSAEAAGYTIVELHHDRGYLAAEGLHERRRHGLKLVSKPPTPARTKGRFGKADFEIDVLEGRVECPSGQEAQISSGKKPAAYFRRSICRSCSLKERCLPKSGQKVVQIHPHEQLFQEMAAELATPEGRQRRRERIAVEHVLARVGAIQGRRARFLGLTKNDFDLQRTAVVANLFVLNGLWAEAA